MTGDPESAVTLNSRGVALIAAGRIEDALTEFQRAMALDPAYVEPYLNAGTALRETGRYAGALSLADRAIAVQPASGKAWLLRAMTLDRLAKVEEAIAAYDRAIALDETVELADGRCLHLKMRLGQWDSMAAGTDRLLRKIEAGHLASTPFHLLPLPTSLAQRRAAAELYARKKFAVTASAFPPPRPRGKKIRVGYFSPDFREHAISYLCAGMIEAHDRRNFEIVGFRFGGGLPDAMTERLERAFDRLIDIKMHTDAEAVALARELNIDIAVDLAGHTTDSRPGIFARRAAPIQATYLGFPGTTGLEAIDYLIADRIVIPPDHRPHYTEKIAALPNCYQINDRKRPFPDVPVTRRDLGLPENAFVFCAFANSYKITPREFDLWMRILSRVQGSVLWLLHGPEGMAENLRKEAAKRGVAPDRLIFAPWAGVTAHLARHQAADLMLDTLTYNGHTTTSDALWMGLPVLTMLGDAFPSRVAASLLTAAGLPELVTKTETEYEAAALELAADPHKLKRFKQHLHDRRMTCALFDTQRFTGNLEAAYRAMMVLYDGNLPTTHFTVEDFLPA